MSELYSILKRSLAAISRWNLCTSHPSICSDKRGLVVTISESPKRARLRFRSLRTFSTLNIGQLSLPSLKKVSVRVFPVAALFFRQEPSLRTENSKKQWRNLESVAQERPRVLTRAASSLNVSRGKRGDTQGPNGKKSPRSRPAGRA